MIRYFHVLFGRISLNLWTASGHAAISLSYCEGIIDRMIDLLVVDYLQPVAGSGRRYENLTQEVTEISRGLKNLAKESQ